MARSKRGFGQITQLPSKRYRARYTGPDQALHNAPHTFETRMDAEAWITDERRNIVGGTWTPPREREARLRGPVRFGPYASAWLAERELKPRTRAHYARLLAFQLAALDATPLRELTPAMVRRWYSTLDPDRPTLRAHAYSLLRAILNTAVSDGELPANPCSMRSAGTAKRVKRVKPASLNELAIITSEMPERLQAMVLLASWCGLRFGEVTELRRKDIDLSAGLVKVRRGVVRANGQVIIGSPKSDAGIRDVAIPPHMREALGAHLRTLPAGRDVLLFPAADGSAHLAPATLYRSFYAARKAAGRTDLRWHDLRHTGATMAAQTGASLAELMSRLGHSTPQAALIYQHAAKGRDAEIAAALSRMASRT